jgi:beta-xylosidase
VLDSGKIIIDGHETDPTLEEYKIYKRNGYYYVFAPAGGVATGWQLVFRSKNIYALRKKNCNGSRENDY